MEGRQAERTLCDRRDTGEVPVFILGSGITESFESRHSHLAKILKPSGRGGRGGRGTLLLKILTVDFDRARGTGARRLTASLGGRSRHQLTGDGNLSRGFPCCDVGQAAPAPAPAEFCIQS